MTNPPQLHEFQNPYETWTDKAKRKFNENPWVPIGCLATCGALIMSAVKMRQGQSTQMNYWMRARVGLQGVTLVVLVLGSQALQRKRAEDAAIAEAAGGAPDEVAEKKRQQAKEEFEERLRVATEVSEMEAKAGLGTSQGVKAPVVDPEAKKQPRAVPEQAPGVTTAAVEQNSSWKWKWWSSKEKDS